MNKFQMDRYFNALAEIRVKCPCSHTMYFPVNGPDTQVCNHCGHTVYRNDLVRFKILLSKEVKKCQRLNLS